MNRKQAVNKMRGVAYILFFLFLLQNKETISGQNTFIISGTIINCTTHSPVDSSVYVTVSLNKKQLYKVSCSEKGKYSVALSDTLNGKEVFVHTSQDQMKVKGKIVEEACNYMCLENLEYMSSDIKKLVLKAEKAKNYVADFCLSPILYCGTAPTIYFKKNKLQIIRSDRYETGDSALCYLNGLMKCRTTMVIELTGKCSPQERNKDTLSLKRAKEIKNILISKGINPLRIVVKGEGDKNYYEYKKEHITRDNYNRKFKKYEGQVVYVSMLSNDFGIESKPKIYDDGDE